MGLPLPSFCCGSESVSTEAKTRRPDDPVSTRIPLMVWHSVVLPGTQRVTEVKAALVEIVPAATAGPVVTLMDCTLVAALGVGLGPGAGMLDEEPELEHPAIAALAVRSQ